MVRSDTNRVLGWLSRHRKGLAVAAYGIVGIVGTMLPVVGAVLSAIPALAIGMVDMNRKEKNAKIIVDKDAVILDSKISNYKIV